MEPPIYEQKSNTGSPIIRWSVGFFCIVLMGLSLLIMIHGDFPDGMTLRRMAGLAMIFLIGLCGMGAIWGNRLSARVLAGIFSVFGLFYLVDEWIMVQGPIFAMSRYAQSSNPLNALRFFLFIGFPCLLFALGGKRLVMRYAVPLLLLWLLHFAGILCHLLAMLLRLDGWRYFLAYLPLHAVILWLTVRSVQVWRRDRKRGWRIGAAGYGSRTYEERLDGTWVSIELRCVSDYRETPLILELPTRDEWRQLPTWTQERHGLIMERIRDVLPAKDYTLIESDPLHA